MILFLFFFNDTATTEIYTLSLHDALPISAASCSTAAPCSAARAAPSSPSLPGAARRCAASPPAASTAWWRSEEHTSELQSQSNLVCRLLLEQKRYANTGTHHTPQHCVSVA